METEKTKTIGFFAVVIITIMILSMAGYEQYIKTKEITAEEGQCWMWMIGEDGIGFGTTTDYCVQLKRNCNNENHNLNCEWIESTVVSNENTKPVEGCECRPSDILPALKYRASNGKELRS